MTPPDDESPLVYAVRIAPATASGMQAEVRRLTADAGASFADTWEHGLLSVIATLATFPERCAVAAENDLFLGGTLRPCCIGPGGVAQPGAFCSVSRRQMKTIRQLCSFI